MTFGRPLTAEEKRLVRALIVISDSERSDLLERLDQVRVTEMSDGGMGSLRFEQAEPNPTWGRRIAQVTFDDDDGVPVLASLDLSSSSNLFELDLFKGDFSPLRRIPEEFAAFEGD